MSHSTKKITKEQCDAILESKKLKRLSEFKNTYTKIKIQCYCDNIFATTLKNIMNGNTTSCGCYKSKRIKETKIKDLVGKRFGRLVVLKYMCSKNRRPIWLCQCDCGTIKQIIGFRLYTKAVTTCGCGLKGYKLISKSYWGVIKNRAKKANIELNISIEEAWEQFEQQNRLCALSNSPLYFSKFYHKETRQQTASLDRIDNTKGYIKDNIWFIHKDINMMKGILTVEHMLWLCENITRNKYKIETNKSTKIKSDLISESWFRIQKSQAFKRNIDFNITLEFLQELFNYQSYKCSISGLDIYFVGRGHNKETVASLDRINNSKGYTEENVQFVHKHINRMKLWFDQDYFINTCIKIDNHQKEKMGTVPE